MAQQIVIVDDIDGTPADETVRFALDGEHYEIDLSAHHAAQLRAELAIWSNHAHRVKNARRLGPARVQVAASTATVRAWANANGHAVSQRGRIPDDVMAAFEAAQQ